MSRDSLINIINDTLYKCDNEYKWMIDNSKNIYYNDNYFKIDSMIKKFSNANIKLIKKTTVDAIIENKCKVFAVLNFASAKKPGGGVLNGAIAQEEALARASSLYPVIKQCEDFYVPTPSAPYYSDRIIYSKNIYVFKDDYGVDIEPIKCDVITCAAPNYSFGIFKYDNHQKVIKQRFTKILKSAIVNGQRNLILGAWGCGVFKNPPNVNAEIFRDVLNDYSNYFDEIIFAIPDNINYDIFKKKLFNLSDFEKDINKYNI